MIRTLAALTLTALCANAQFMPTRPDVAAVFWLGKILRILYADII